MPNYDVITTVSNIYIECKLNTLPIDCFAILRHFGFRYFSYSQLQEENHELYILCSSYSNDAFMHKRKRIVAYNDKINWRRTRFSIMHELGHHFLATDNEDDANEFASHFLAPRILIHKYGYRTANQIHDFFGLSYAASNRALLSYRKWVQNIACSATRKPSEPELQLEQMFFPSKPEVISNPVVEEDDDELRPLDPLDKYLLILRILQMGIPVPDEYKKDVQRYKRLGFRLK